MCGGGGLCVEKSSLPFPSKTTQTSWLAYPHLPYLQVLVDGLGSDSFLEVFWEGAVGEGWNDGREVEAQCSSWEGGAGFPLGWWESGVRGISIARSGQPAKPRLAEDGWRTISW